MILSCQNINKSFVTDDVLKDVSFHLEEREKAALIGPNGAGKTTLVNIIFGLYTADSGEILWKGKPADLASPKEAIEAFEKFKKWAWEQGQ